MDNDFKMIVREFDWERRQVFVLRNCYLKVVLRILEGFIENKKFTDLLIFGE